MLALAAKKIDNRVEIKIRIGYFLMTSGDVGRIIADANFLPINQIRSTVLQTNKELDRFIFDSM
jgi:hypothetical protein